MPFQRGFKTGGQHRVAFLHAARRERGNFIRTLVVAFRSLAWLLAEIIQKIINVFRCDGAHDPITKVRENVIIQIAAVAVEGIRRRAFLARVEGQPFFCELTVPPMIFST